jgi:hypothetical protein
MTMRRALNLFIAAFAITLFCQAPAALAEDGCPPGMWPHGTRTPADPLGCVPRPDLVEQQQQRAPQRQQGPMVFSRTMYAAVAWHSDANDVWAVADFDDENEAKEAVMAGCTLVMGKGCAVGLTVRNGSIAIGRDNVGGIWAGKGAKPKMAEQQMQKACAANAGRCKIMHSYTAKETYVFTDEAEMKLRKIYFPGLNNIRNVYGSAAWSEANSPSANVTDYGNKIWVSGGKPTLEAAHAAAISACEAATKAKCKTANYSINGFIAIARDTTHGVYTSVDLTQKDAAMAVAKLCKDSKKKCGKAQIVDIRIAKDTMIDTVDASKSK